MDNFYIITNNEKDYNYEFAEEISRYIQSKGKKCIYHRHGVFKEHNKINFVDVSKIPKDTQTVIVLGGDGTLIQAARVLSSVNIPVFGINIGTLGYLTEIDREQALPAMDLLINDQYYIEKRMILSGYVYRNGEKIYSDIALNDIVVNRVGPLSVIDFDIFVNDEFLISYPADGLIISTPTGSTAYNLSAGGPIMRPEIDVISLTPICPHVLNKSSVIFGGNDTLEIKMCHPRNNKEQRVVTFDGTNYIDLITDDVIRIEKSSLVASLIRTQKQNFLQILRKKLS